MNKNLQEIREQGYTILPKVLKDWEIIYLHQLVKNHYLITKDQQSKDVPYLNNNQPNVYNLQNKDINFINILFGLKDVEEILIDCLNDKWYKQIPQDQPNYILRSFGARSSNSALPLHIDSFIPYQGDEVIAMQVAIMLEDSTFENGCTTCIPGTHQYGKYASNDSLSMEIVKNLECKAGDILIWDSRLWHGTTDNKTEGTRWAIIATFTRWWIKQHFDIPNNIPRNIEEKLTPKDKQLLGYCSVPFKNEFEGIDLKRGLEI
jgi:hypothetical protein